MSRHARKKCVKEEKQKRILPRNTTTIQRIHTRRVGKKANCPSVSDHLTQKKKKKTNSNNLYELEIKAN